MRDFASLPHEPAVSKATEVKRYVSFSMMYFRCIRLVSDSGLGAAFEMGRCERVALPNLRCHVEISDKHMSNASSARIWRHAGAARRQRPSGAELDRPRPIASNNVKNECKMAHCVHSVTP
ncbi:hypothetical protein EVAR_60070_1 [Eumeta japonica]|uniref:Uncharacterized protein n=1 Tax=Eumeta variegata TaxID=151549 RepID=A0A4C1ZJX3_EUMVA|nr:hypothetical protein EVAR_60070_1 [Eumeta japonica]